jgi:peptide deformylase
MKETISLVTYPTAALFEQSAPVEVFDEALRDKLQHMMMACDFFHGIGLAGVQIGYNQNIIFINHDAIVEYEQKQREQSVPALLNKPLFLINPVITERSEETFESEEGCLSLPGIRAKVTRAVVVVVEYQDEFGQKQKMDCSLPYLSACVQHEVDHTQGITLLQRVSPESRHILARKISEFLKKNKDPLFFTPYEGCAPGCNHHH